MKEKIEMGVRIKDGENHELSSAIKFFLYVIFIAYIVSVACILVGTLGSMQYAMVFGTVLFIISSLSFIFIHNKIKK